MLMVPCKNCGEFRETPVLIEEPCIKCGYIPMTFKNKIESVALGCLLAILFMLIVWPVSVLGDEKVSGYVDGKYVRATSQTSSNGTVTTRGYVGNKYIRTKSRTNKQGVTTTKGYVGGKYVRIKTRKKR